MLVVFEAMSRRVGALVDDDVLFKFRLRLFSLAAELGNVRAACRMLEVHPTRPTYRLAQPGPALRTRDAPPAWAPAAADAQPAESDHR